MKFSSPEYWSGQPFSSPGDLPKPEDEPRSPPLQADSLQAEVPGKPYHAYPSMKYSLDISNFLRNFPILLLSSISLHCSFKKAFLSFLAILWNSAFSWVYLSLSPLPLASLLSSVICKASLGFHDSSTVKESACNARDLGLIPASGRFAGERIGYPLQYSWASLMAQLVKNLPAMQETWIQSLGWEDPLEKGTGYPLQYSGLENSMDYIVNGVTKSWTQLGKFHLRQPLWLLSFLLLWNGFGLHLLYNVMNLCP